MSDIITIEPTPILTVLDEHGWTQGHWEDSDGRVCLHGAVRLCSPRPGDSHLIERVAARQGWGTTWNDAEDRTEDDVRARAALGVHVTDQDLADTFGPQWRAVVSIVRRAAVLTGEEVKRLAAAESAAWSAAWSAARSAAEWSAAGSAARAAARAAAGAARSTGTAAVAAAGSTGMAAVAAVTWHLATPDGPYTLEHRDLLIAPWESMFGLPEELTREGDTDE